LCPSTQRRNISSRAYRHGSALKKNINELEDPDLPGFDGTRSARGSQARKIRTREGFCKPAETGRRGWNAASIPPSMTGEKQKSGFFIFVWHIFRSFHEYI
jgi:hypothetical protein